LSKSRNWCVPLSPDSEFNSNLAYLPAESRQRKAQA
jgi:hypothetical protein